MKGCSFQKTDNFALAKCGNPFCRGFHVFTQLFAQNTEIGFSFKLHQIFFIIPE